VDNWYRAGFSISENGSGNIHVVVVTLHGRAASSVTLAFPDPAPELTTLSLGDLKGQEPFTSKVLSQVPAGLKSLRYVGELSSNAREIIRQRLNSVEVIAFQDTVLNSDDIAMLSDLRSLKTIDIRNASIGPDVATATIDQLRQRVGRIHFPEQNRSPLSGDNRTE